MKNIVKSIIEACLEPVDAGVEMPNTNRFGIVSGIFTTEGFPKTITVTNTIPEGHLCPVIVEKVAEFDFWNEFEGFCNRAGKTPKSINWNSSWLGLVIGDRILDTTTMKLYKVTGFNKSSGGAEIYFDVA